MNYIQNVRRLWIANIGWCLLVLLGGYWLYRHHELREYGVLFFTGALAGWLFLGGCFLYLFKNALRPRSTQKKHFRSGAFVENLRTDVRVIVARMSICVVEEWKISRGLPLPGILEEIPFLSTLCRLRDETTLRMVARDNRVQYGVSLSELKEEDVCYDPQSGRLSLHLPELRLDEDIIQVQSDPTKIWIMTEKGFYDRMTDWLSGGTSKTKELMRGKLRELVIEEANSPDNLALARKNAALELSSIVKVLAARTTPCLLSGVDISFGNHKQIDLQGQQDAKA